MDNSVVHKENIKFSIICPVYNKDKYLSYTINSVKMQSYSSWELILIDDGSTDNSADIMFKSNIEDSRIKCFFSKKNRGPLFARIYGLEKSSGDYLLFLDADDTLEKDCLSVLASKIKGYKKPDIIRFGWSRIYDDGKNFIGYKQLVVFSHNEFLEGDLFKYKEALCNEMINNIIFTCTKRKCFNDLTSKIEHIIDCITAEDLLLQFPICDMSNSVLCIDDRLYNYRFAKNSITTNKIDLNNLSSSINPYRLSFIKPYLYKWDMYDKIISKVHKNAFYTVSAVIRKSLIQNSFLNVRKTMKREEWLYNYIDRETLTYILNSKETKTDNLICKCLIKRSSLLLFILFLRFKMVK